MNTKVLIFLLAVVFGSAFAAPPLPAPTLDTVNFIGAEILSRPTNHSVTVSVIPRVALVVRFEYGTDTTYGSLTPAETTVADTPHFFVLGGLLPDLQYYYRMRYVVVANGESLVGPGRTFHTQRPPGEKYVFDVEADPHMLPAQGDTAPAFEQTLATLAADKPDFLVDLGDNFMFDKWKTPAPETILMRVLDYRQWWSEACHSIPLFITLGNHEGEQGWDLDSTPTSTPVLFTNARKRYYWNPVPDGFYTGDTIPEQYVGLRQDYYAWNWGNVQFVVLDPYWHTMTKPHGLETNWDWTLGRAQYDWLKQTLEQSSAKFKFVFIHHLVGGNIDSSARGGIEYAHFYEWGGLRSDSTWGFDSLRSGWGVPIHQLLIDNHVDILWHGHDHFFGKQDTDGIVYQECPQPARARWESLPNQAPKYGYKSGVIMGSRGYTRVTMDDTSAKVEYVRTFLPSETSAVHHNGDVAYSYTIVKHGSGGVDSPKSLPSPASISVSPNPFRTRTAISLQLTAHSPARIAVYDASGRLVRVLASPRPLTPDPWSLIWDGRDQVGAIVPPGVYFVRAADGVRQQIVKVR
ncbi:MAG TPA: metallophosphoesterase [bacterium]|nr:metallophosphoesterase [bacterium]